MDETDFNLRAKDWDEEPRRVERAKAVGQAIQQQIVLSPQTRAFEYGCGTGLLSFELQPYLGSITLADSASLMLEVLNGKIVRSGVKKMQPLLLDLAVDPPPPGQYDLIYTLMVLHHIQNTGRVLQAFYDLLAPGGSLCIADLDEEDGSFHGPAFQGHRGFNRRALGARLQELGFRDVRFTTPYTIHKFLDEQARPYTVFLATGVKP